MPRFT